MPYMHKLSCRLSLLKDFVWALPVLGLLGCELPGRNIGPQTIGPLARLDISPKSALIRVNQTKDVAVVGFTAAGDTAAIAMSFLVRGTAGGALTGTSNPGRGRAIGHYRAGTGVGRDTVIAADTSGMADTSVVDVTPMPVSSVTVTPPSATLRLGGSTAFTATTRDSTAAVLTGRVITWASTAPSIASVDANGGAAGVAVGFASIIATSEGKSDTSIVTVTVVPVASVTVTPPAATILVGQTAAFSATTRDSAGTILTGRVITWISTAPGVASVNASGVATGVSAGSASIVATSEGKSDTSVVTVTAVPVASVTVTPATATVAVGGITPFTATTRDSAGTILTGRVITWAATAPAVATVNASGVATGVSAGSASIIATSEGKSDTSVVTVIVVPVASVTVTPAAATVQVGLTTAFTATLRDSAGNPLTGRVVTWASSNPSVATVNGSGVVTGVAAGTDSVIATSEGKSDTATVTVVAPPPPPAGGVPDPTLLPIATVAQGPNFTAYNALNVRNQPAGFSYNDPVSNVKIWKVTSSTVPAANSGAGHDYGEGGNEVSSGWGPNSNTHTLLIRGDGMAYYLVDFTRGVGFSNYRLLTVQPRRDLSATFSSRASEARILYLLTGSQLVRYNTQTMQVENTGNFPRAVTAFGWLHQDKNDVWFTGLLADNQTVWVWNSQTNQYLTHNETWANEPRLERDGRYVVITGGGNGPVRYWDLSNNTFGPTQTTGLNFYFSHLAACRSLWVSGNPNANPPFRQDRYEVSGGQVTRTTILTQSWGAEVSQAGNWIQSDAELGGNLYRQWYFGTGVDEQSWASQLLWDRAVGVSRLDGSDQRLVLHHYDSDPLGTTGYFSLPWGKPSPDGKVVVFNTNMNGATRYDLFVAELPLR